MQEGQMGRRKQNKQTKLDVECDEDGIGTTVTAVTAAIAVAVTNSGGGLLANKNKLILYTCSLLILLAGRYN